jgi:S-adenosylmethionine decarboxylase
VVVATLFFVAAAVAAAYACSLRRYALIAPAYLCRIARLYNMAYYHVLGALKGPCIEHVAELQEKMDAVAAACAFTVRARSFVQFEPVGATGVLVLAESHFSAHSYPEKNELYMDVFCCSSTFKPDECIATIERVFGGRGAWQIIER